MKKILLSIDAVEPNMSAIDFACYIARLSHSPLTGVFLEYQAYEGQRNKLTPEAVSQLTVREFEEMQERNMSAIYIEQNIRLFKEACEKRGVQTRIHRDRNVPLEEMAEESRYADMIISDPSLSFSDKTESIPSHFVKKIMGKAECPVIIAPGSFYGIEEIIFTYDGSASSVFAIKQFAYLFPELNTYKVTLLEACEEEKNCITEKHQITEWLKLHYQQFSFSILHGDPTTQLLDYCLKARNKFIVLGAYGRSQLSYFFRHSQADPVVKTTNAALFISHI